MARRKKSRQRVLFSSTGELVRSRRVALGLTQAELAERIGCASREVVNHVEHGRQLIPGYHVLDYANALKVRPVELLEVMRSDWRVRS